MIGSPHDPRSPLNVPPDTASPAQLLMVLQAMNARLATITAEQARQGKRLERLEAQTEGVRKAWEAGGWALKALTTLGAIAVAIGGIWALITGQLTGGEQ